MYETIFSPVNYGGLELKNRIIFAPTTFGLSDEEYFAKIRAIAAGKVAAANIDEYLGFHHRMKNDVDIPPVRLDDFNTIGRINMKERPAEERARDFELMECGMTEEEACQEAGRCLRCDHFGFGVFRGGRVEKW